jgi:aminoglycoside 2''-phosphotransferase
MRCMPGETIAAQPVRGRSARSRLARDLGRFLSTLHGVPVEEARRAGVRDQDLWTDEYAPLVERALPLLPPATRAWLERRCDDFVRGGGSRDAPRVLVHGDIWGQNLLVDESGALSGVIDFGDARIGDPALDFAGVLNDFPWPFLERVWSHYRGAVDADAARRTRFYSDVAPLYRVVYGEEGLGAR